MAKERTNKALLITSIILTVLALVGVTFSMVLGQAVNDLLHPAANETSETAEGGNDASQQAGRAIATVFVAILVIPIWLLVEVITLALDIPSLVMSSTLCGRLAREKRALADIQTEQADRMISETDVMPETTAVSQSKKGMKIASIVLIVLNVAILAALVIMTVSVLI